MRRPGDRDRGASMVEYAGLIVLAALLVVGIVSTGLPGGISGGVGTAICRIFNGTDCGPQPGGPTNRSHGDDPITDPGNGGTPEPHAPSPVTIPNVVNGAGSYLSSATAGIGDFFKRWILPKPPKPDGGPTQGWPGFWHGLWRSVWDDNLKHLPEELLGAGKELIDQAKGLGDVVKLAWCAGGVPRRCSEKDTQDARNTLKYIHDHPRDALKQVGESIIEPCKTAVEHGGYEQAGRCGASIITTIIGAKGLNKLGKLGKLGKAGKAAELAGKLKGLARFSSDANRAARAAERAARSGNLTAARRYAAQARRALDRARNALRRAGCRPVAAGLVAPIHLGGRASITMEPNPTCPTGRRKTFQARKEERRAAQAIAQAQAKLLTREIRAVELPTKGRVRFIAARGARAVEKVPGAGPGGATGYRDRFGNIWVKGPSRTPGQPFEWDVQLRSEAQQRKWQWLFRLKKKKGTIKHLNVSTDGHITHVS